MEPLIFELRIQEYFSKYYIYLKSVLIILKINVFKILLIFNCQGDVMLIYKEDNKYFVKICINGKQIFRRKYLRRTINYSDAAS